MSQLTSITVKMVSSTCSPIKNEKKWRKARQKLNVWCYILFGSKTLLSYHGMYDTVFINDVLQNNIIFMQIIFVNNSTGPFKSTRVVLLHESDNTVMTYTAKNGLQYFDGVIFQKTWENRNMSTG